MQLSSPVFAEPLLHEEVSQTVHCNRNPFRLLSLFIGLVFTVLLRSVPFAYDGQHGFMTNKFGIQMVSHYMQKAMTWRIIQLARAQQSMQTATTPNLMHALLQPPNVWQVIRPAKAWQSMQLVRAEKSPVRLVIGGDGDHRAEVKARPLDTGVLMRFRSDKGFGFIRADSNGEELFVHAYKFTNGKDSVQDGNKVTYVRQWDHRQGKYEATEVRLAPNGEGDHRDESSWPPPDQQVPKDGTGVLMWFRADKGFGFIRAEGSGAEIFAHASNFVDGQDSVQEGNKVTYVKQWNKRSSKYEAAEVRLAPSGEGDHRAEIIGPPPDQAVPEGGTGVLMRFRSDKGFGFIRAEGSGGELFTHISNFVDGQDSVREGNRVTYLTQWNNRSKSYEACKVRLAPSGEGDHRGQQVLEGRTGVLIRYQFDKGFGFIRAEGSVEELFANASNFVDGKDSVQEGNKVTYIPKWNRNKGRYEAAEVRLALGDEGDHFADVSGPSSNLPVLEGSIGVLMTWNSDKGFGLIKAEGSGKEVFVNASKFVNENIQPGNKVAYALVWNSRNIRYEATRVRLALDGDSAHRAEVWTRTLDDQPIPQGGIGILVRFRSDKDFGFIRAEGSIEELFVHASNFVDGKDSVQKGNKVTYVLDWNANKGRYEAAEVRLAIGGEGDHRAKLSLAPARGRNQSMVS